MNHIKTKPLLLLAALLAVCPFAPAAELGDPAPPLKIADWVKGKPVDLAAVKGKQVVVVRRTEQAGRTLEDGTGVSNVIAGRDLFDGDR